jgi:hypothetical protein
MTDDITKSESKLRKLGEQLRQAWAKQNPLTQRELEAVRQAVRKQWEMEQQVKVDVDRKVSPPPPPANHRRDMEMEQRAKTLAHSRKHGHSH